MVRALNDVPEFFALCVFAASPFSRLPSPTKEEVCYAIAGTVGAAVLVAAAIVSIRAFVPRCLTFTTLVDLSSDQLRDLRAVIFPVCHSPERPLLAGGAVLGAGGTEGNNTSAESRLETKDLAGYALVGRISRGNDAYQLRWLCLYVKTDSPRIRHSFTIDGGRPPLNGRHIRTLPHRLVVASRGIGPKC